MKTSLEPWKPFSFQKSAALMSARTMSRTPYIGGTILSPGQPSEGASESEENRVPISDVEDRSGRRDITTYALVNRKTCYNENLEGSFVSRWISSMSKGSILSAFKMQTATKANLATASSARSVDSSRVVFLSTETIDSQKRDTLFSADSSRSPL